MDVGIAEARDRPPAAVPAEHADIGMLPVDLHSVRGDDRQSVVEYGPGQAVVLDEIPVAWADGDIAETLAVDGDNFAAPDTDRAAHSAGALHVDVGDLLGETVVGSALGEFDRVLHRPNRSEEHTSELQSLMRISYAVFCFKTKTTTNQLLSSEQQQSSVYTT